MMFTKILVPYDGSEHAKSALEYAKGLAQMSPDVKIDIVQVIPAGIMGANSLGTDGALDGVPFGMLDYEEYQEVIKNVMGGAQQQVVEELGDAIAGLGERVTVAAIAGSSPADALSDYAKENGCDLIVMGRRGLGAIRGMLGSVSFGILRETDIPVLTVK